TWPKQLQEFRRVIRGVVGFVWVTWDAVLGQNADNQRHLMKTPQGQALPMHVKEIKEKTVVVDLNHPLAGKTLTFDVKINDQDRGAQIISGSSYPSNIKKPGLGSPSRAHNDIRTVGFRLSPLFFLRPLA